MIKIIDLIGLTLGLFFLLSGNAQSQKSLTKHVDPNKKDPIEISSDRMRSEANGDKIVFSGNVIGHWGDLEIISDVLEIYNSQNRSKSQKIIAIGNVTIIRGTKKAKGDRAVYLDQEQKVIMTGTPKALAWEGKNRIEGREMIFLLEKDKFVVNDRVRMKLYPGKKNKAPIKRKKTGSQNQTKISKKN